MAVPTNRLLLTGCLMIGVAIPLHAQRAGAAPRCSGVADFVDVEGRDTVTRARVAVTDSTFESTTHDVTQGALVRYRGRLTSAGDIQSLHLEAWPHVADSAGPPSQIADVTVQGTEIMARVAAPTRGMQMQHDRLPPGGIMYMTGAPLFLELLQRHVHLAVGATTTVHALWLFTGGAVDTVQVSRPSADSLRVRFPQIEYLMVLAPDRSILSSATLVKPGTDGKPSLLSRRDCR